MIANRFRDQEQFLVFLIPVMCSKIFLRGFFFLTPIPEILDFFFFCFPRFFLVKCEYFLMTVKHIQYLHYL